MLGRHRKNDAPGIPTLDFVPSVVPAQRNGSPPIVLPDVVTAMAAQHTIVLPDVVPDLPPIVPPPEVVVPEAEPGSRSGLGWPDPPVCDRCRQTSGRAERPVGRS